MMHKKIKEKSKNEKANNLYFGNRFVACPCKCFGTYRADLYNAGYGNGYHAFSYPISWKTYTPGQYQVYAYGINGSTNLQLASSPRNFTVRAATGTVDSITYNGISGWAWKPDAPNESINVHIYIRRANGEQVALYAPVAGNYRSDLYNLGYGNGYHGFYKSIDWESLPREILTVQVYAVDGSGYHPCFYNQTFDNRKEIYLLGARGRVYDDDDNLIGYADFSSWMDSTVLQNCEEIGAYNVVKLRDFSAEDVIDAIYSSRFCLINTHGFDDGSGIECEDHDNYTGLFASDFSGYGNNYFSNTKCVTLMSCYCALGNYNNDNNLLNTLERKGVETVVGFEDEITFHFYSDETIVNTMSSGLWGRNYIAYLSDGASVNGAANEARTDVYEQSGGTTSWGFDSLYMIGLMDNILTN